MIPPLFWPIFLVAVAAVFLIREHVFGPRYDDQIKSACLEKVSHNAVECLWVFRRDEDGQPLDGVAGESYSGNPLTRCLIGPERTSQ